MEAVIVALVNPLKLAVLDLRHMEGGNQLLVAAEACRLTEEFGLGHRVLKANHHVYLVVVLPFPEVSKPRHISSCDLQSSHGLD